ncbi:MAG: VWA domain-containing protein [Bacteroidetes bacterium]|nr:VWA domain-containing protein [Bacteroidota bacterium]
MDRAKRIFFGYFLSVFTAWCMASGLQAQTNPTKYRILFVFDASGSMYGKWQGKLKMESAKRVLIDLVDSLERTANVQMALRVYGHQFPRNCEDSKLEVPFSSGNAATIKSVLLGLNPKGITPIAYSLERAAYDFPKDGDAKNVLILITDGVEECGGDPCGAAMALQQNGVVMKPFVIGLGLDNSKMGKLDCVGRFINAESESSLENIMKVVVSSVLDNTTVQVNLLDHNQAPTETDVAMSFVDKHTGQVLYNLVHTLDELKQPDRFIIDASPVYSLKVHTIPPIFLGNLVLQPGTNNIIDVKAAQGILHLKMDGSLQYPDLKCLVYSEKTGDLVHVQNINTRVKYLEGAYTIEVLTLPRTRYAHVKVTSKATEIVTVAPPGQLDLDISGSFVGGIYTTGNTPELVVSIETGTRRQIILLQPGKYRLLSRHSNFTETLYTKSREFEIKGLSTIKLNIN